MRIRINSMSFSIAVTLFVLARASVSQAGDWPMWRCDSGHTAASPHALPNKMHLQWTRRFSPRIPVWDDPLNQDMMPYDRIFEPIVADGRLFLGFNDSDKVVAMDVRDGSELWTFRCDGPVRLAPAAAADAVFFCSDDGYLYCLNARDGTLRWRFHGGPSARKIIGNRRIISSWPARGGPVVQDDTVYFAAGIWPFMGVFIYALDAETGQVQWIHDDTSAEFQKQPHSAPSFAGVAPQGSLTVAGDLLLVPGGRSLPAALNRDTGDLAFFEFGGKGQGGSFVAADDQTAFVHTRVKGTMALELPGGTATKYRLNEPVITQSRLYTASGANEQENGPPTIDAYDRHQNLLWQVEADGTGDLIQAGDRLYAAGATAITAIEIPVDGQPAKIVWSAPVEGSVQRLLAASDRLFAVTEEGGIMAFGRDPSAADSGPAAATESLQVTDRAQAQAARLLSESEQNAGYAVWFGIDDPALLEATVTQSQLHIVAIDKDPAKVARLRERFDAAGLYGDRIAVQVGGPEDFRAPPYVANLIVVRQSLINSVVDPTGLAAVFESVRPYGGRLWIECDSARQQEVLQQIKSQNLPKANCEVTRNAIVVTRVGALPGAADWTHAYGDVANTVKSNDRRVKLPLGILWFGGISNMDILPRHGHGPSQQVVGGRLFIEGMNSLTSLDVYTGRRLWKRSFADLGTYQIYFDETYQDTPLSTQYNQVHIPGANARGTNYVATEQGVYLVIHDRCLLLDAESGETRRQFVLPPLANGESPEWGYVGVYEDLLLAGVGFADYSKRLGYEVKSEGKRGPAWGPDHSGSMELLAFDRETGSVRWRVKARHSFLHNGIVAGGGRVYLLDVLPKRVHDWNLRRGIDTTGDYRLLAVSSESGDIQWQSDDVFGSWLSYSSDQDYLLQAGSAASDRSPDEIGKGMAVYRGRDGELVWKDSTLSYAGPCILHGDSIITNSTSYKASAGAFNLLDGSPEMVRDPVTGEEFAWKFIRTYGCNTAVASENLLTFRSGAAGFYDLANHGGTGNFGGFKSGCSSNLIIANGVLTAPDYTRTCTCGYQNQTSLAMIPMPENELWTYNLFGQRPADAPRHWQRLGVNFAAPGDRLSDDGTLWVNFPPDQGTSPKVEVELTGDIEWYSNHALRITGGELPWVAASGVAGAHKVRIWLTPPAERQSGIVLPVRDSQDDAEESMTGDVSLGSSDLELTEDGGEQTVGLRFQQVPLDQGAKIERVYIQFAVDESNQEPTDLTIWGQAADNAPVFHSETNDISSRENTTAFVSWKPKPWSDKSKPGLDHQTPDLREIVTEIIQRPGWKHGNAMAFIIRGTGKRVATSAEGSQRGFPKLIIETVDQQETVNNETDQSKMDAKPYRVRLVFADPNPGAIPGQRQFDVLIQGELVLSRLDIASETGGGLRAFVTDWHAVSATDHIDLELRSESDLSSVLSGVEIVPGDSPSE
jgi:outer membrane protein assembly factor BamB